MKVKIHYRINMRTELEIPCREMAKAALLMWCKNELKMPDVFLKAISIDKVEEEK